MVAFLKSLVDEHPMQVAIADRFGAATWAQLNDRVNRLANALRRRRVNTGDRIVCVVSNRREFFEVLLAVRSVGAFVIPTSPESTRDELKHIMSDSAAVLVIAESSEALEQATKETPVEWLRVGDRWGDATASYELELASAEPGEPPNETLGAVMPYTSGTTGKPKGVLPTNKALGGPTDSDRANMRALAGILRQPGGGAALTMAPVYHMGPLGFSLLAVAQGATLHVAPRFDAIEMLRTIANHQINVLYAVPTYFVRLLRLSAAHRHGADTASLKYVYHTGAPCPPDVKLAMIDWWGPVLFEGYGASEGGMIAFCDSEDYVGHPGTVGKLLPNLEAVVIGAEGRPLEPGQTGSLYFRNRSGSDFQYLNDSEKTRDAHLEPGLFTFGDRGFLDHDGFLHLVGRESEMVIRGGVNIYPAEIEHVLMTHSAVADVAVIGEPDADLGQRVLAVIQLVDGELPSPSLTEELRAVCRSKLAKFKMPRDIAFIDELPRTATGKVRKHLISRGELTSM